MRRRQAGRGAAVPEVVTAQYNLSGFCGEVVHELERQRQVLEDMQARSVAALHTADGPTLPRSAPRSVPGTPAGEARHRGGPIVSGGRGDHVDVRLSAATVWTATAGAGDAAAVAPSPRVDGAWVPARSRHAAAAAQQHVGELVKMYLAVPGDVGVTP